MTVQSGFASASGYEALMNSPLARVGYEDNIIAKIWEEDFLPLITNTKILERLTQCFQVIQFMEEADVGKWRKYELNQELITDNISPGGFEVRICNAAYKALKFDQLDIKMICDRWPQFEESFLNSAHQGLSQMWTCYVLDAMVLEADRCNKGNAAGVYGNVDVGVTGAPRTITGTSFAIEVAKMKRILEERNRWQDGKMFILLPPAISELMVSSPYANAMDMGSCVDCSLLATGQMPGKVVGFDVFQTNYVPTVMESNKPAYYIIAGHMDAYAFAGDITNARMKEPSRYFGVEYQMQAIWGGKLIYSDAIVIGYWTV